MKFEQLFYLKEAIKYKSISIAAEKNYISQSTLSGAIIRLEKELGVDLLRRSTTGVQPTELGTIVLEKANTIFSSMEEIIQVTSKQGQSGIVNISCIPCICNQIIPMTLQKLHDNSSPITLSITTAESSTIAHNVSAGISEFGILIHYNGLEKNADLKYTPLFRDEYMLYVGRDSPYWDKDSITLDEAIHQPYIAYREEFLKENGGLTNVLGSTRTPSIVFRTDDLDSIKCMIVQNNYVAFFPKFMSQYDTYLQNGLVRSIPISDQRIEFEVGYIESAKYKITSIDTMVIDVIKQTVSSLHKN